MVQYKGTAVRDKGTVARYSRTSALHQQKRSKTPLIFERTVVRYSRTSALHPKNTTKTIKTQPIVERTVVRYSRTIAPHRKTQQKHNQLLNVQWYGAVAPLHRTKEARQKHNQFWCAMVRCRCTLAPNQKKTTKTQPILYIFFLDTRCDYTVRLYPCPVRLYLCTVPLYLNTVPLRRTTNVSPHRTLLLAVPTKVLLRNYIPETVAHMALQLR